MLLQSDTSILREDYGPWYQSAAQAAYETALDLDGADLSNLAKNSPGLGSGWSWSNYLTCSIGRAVRVVDLLSRMGAGPLQVLDYGSYLGNMSRLLDSLGYVVTAADAYLEYEPALNRVVESLAKSEIEVIDTSQDRFLEQAPARRYDVILCLGVIEHVPHSPRRMLRSLVRQLTPGGVLVIDTPNAAYLPMRRRLASGQSTHPDVRVQFPCDVFEGHHREYTQRELVWMLRQVGIGDGFSGAFNYSYHGRSEIPELEHPDHWRMIHDPDMREVLLVAGRVGDGPLDYMEMEGYWCRRFPAEVIPSGEEDMAATIVALEETMAREIARRDEMLINAELALHRARDGWPLWRKALTRLRTPHAV